MWHTSIQSNESLLYEWNRIELCANEQSYNHVAWIEYIHQIIRYIYSIITVTPYSTMSANVFFLISPFWIGDEEFVFSKPLFIDQIKRNAIKTSMPSTGEWRRSSRENHHDEHLYRSTFNSCVACHIERPHTNLVWATEQQASCSDRYSFATHRDPQFSLSSFGCCSLNKPYNKAAPLIIKF